MKSLPNYTTPELLFLQFVPLIIQTGPPQNQRGHQRSSIASRGVAVSVTIAISLTPPRTAISSILVNFQYHLALTQQFPKHHVANQLIERFHTIWTLYTLTSHSETAPQLEVINMPWCLSTMPQDIIGLLASNPFSMMISLRHSWRSGMKQVPSHTNSDVTAMRNSSAAAFGHSSNSNKSSIVSSPAGRQSGNGLVEAHWKIMVHMS
jgi:hypothetical protein